MRKPIAGLICGAALGVGLPAWAQAPSPQPPPAVPGGPPGAPFVVPVAPPPEAPPPRVMGRVGFGLGLYGIPGNAVNGAGGLGGASFGGETGIRWWVTERFALIPAILLSVRHDSTPETESPYGDVVPGTETTSASVGPAVLFSYAAYRGRTTRFMLSAGPSFLYSVSPSPAQYPDGRPKPVPDEIKRATFAVLAGFALEQFFTPRISVVLSVNAPVFAYSSVQKNDEDSAETVSADFSSTRLGGSVYFYTD